MQTNPPHLSSTAARARLRAAAVAVIVAWMPSSSDAWNLEGHQAAALISSGYLSEPAAAELRELLGDVPEVALPAFSNWADEVRAQRPETKTWHYVDIPVGASGYLGWRDCANGECLIVAIERQRKIAADRQAPAAQRREAVLFLVHLIADLHNPLHCANNADAGGNGTRVRYQGMESNLHRLWDGDLVLWQAGPGPWGSSLAQSISIDEAAYWRTGRVIDWANESHRLAVQVAYGALPPPGPDDTVEIQDSYLERVRPVVALQLKRAGVRLAEILNRALGRDPAHSSTDN